MNLDSALTSVLAGSGVAGVVVVLFVLGLICPRTVVADKDKQIAELKEALKAERDRADTAVAATSATNSILAAIQAGQALGHRGERV